MLALCLSAALSPAPARAAAQPGAAGKAIQLFNGRDLSGWTAVSSKPDVKTEDVWSVRDGAIHCVGHPAGYLRTNDDFTAFVLKFQWRTLKKGNSGCLIRCQAPPDKVWPKSVECQLETNNAGDIWVIDDFPIQFDPPSRLEGRHVKRLHESSEKPLGEWNQYEITADGGGKLELKVNGVVQNVAHDVQVIPGKILFQSEGAEIEFKNVELTPLEAKASAKGSAATTKKSAAPKNRPPLLSGGEGEGEPKPLLNGKDLSG